MNGRDFFTRNWKAKVISLLVAVLTWYLVADHLKVDEPQYPIPGTGSSPARTNPTTAPALDESLLAPLRNPPTP